MSDNDTIEVKRRRQGASSGPESGERAEAQQRRRPTGQGGLPPGEGPSGGGGGGGGLPIGKGTPLWLIILLVIVFVGYNLLSGGGSSDSPTQGEAAPTREQPAQVEPVTKLEPTETLAPTRPAPTRVASQNQVAGQKQKWTVMLYQDADDQILEQDIVMDLNEVERVGSTDQVNIVAQIDRYKGAYSGDGNWTSTRRYYIRQDNDLQALHSDLVQDMGELDMASGNTLVDFVKWAAQAYPADKYVLILSDHGMGWPGGWSDPDPKARDSSRLPIASAFDDDQMFTNELDGALSAIQQQAGINKLELIGMDACLMSHLEVLNTLEPYARYAVVSQETEPSLGWAYASFLGALTQNPGMDGAELGRQIVQSYIKDDQRIVDKQARADFLRQGSPAGGLFGSVSADQLAKQLSQDVTLSAVDLSALPALNQSVNDLAYQLQSEDSATVASARTYAQSFTNIFGGKQSPYIDLGSFVQLLKREGVGAKASTAADRVLASVKQAVVAEKHGSGKPGATGVSIYFPNSSLYRSAVAGPQSYTGVAKRFAEASLWDDYLAYHYNDMAFKPSAKAPAVPPAGSRTKAPGLGQITVSAITASGRTAAPGQPVTLTAQINGTNIGYIYLFVGLYDRSANSIFIADRDYLESPTSRQVGGIYYPVWKEGSPFTMKLQWDPTLFEVSDGSKSVVALLNPQLYGSSAQDTVYTADGIYTYTESGEKRNARLYFRNGNLEHIYGFTQGNQAGSPAEIIPQAGDTFTFLENWWDLDNSGKVTAAMTQAGETLTFGDQMFTWKEVYAAKGDYLVGFVIEDMDGNQTPVYTQIRVQ